MLRRTLPRALSSASSSLHGVPLDATSINANVRAAEYAVRGNVLERSMELQRRMAAGEMLPFKKFVPCNIGNPHALLQLPLSFHRDVLALCISPHLATDHPSAFNPDAVERAQKYATGMGGGVGSYTNSQGILAVREEIAAFIAERDGHPAYVDRIYLTNGASEGVRMLLTCLLRGGELRDGLLTPIPQYPLYSASLTLLGGTLVPYHLNESRDWGVQMENLAEALATARGNGVEVRGIAVINPGNPTGNILAEDQIKDIIQMAVDNKLVILADEVYQSNIWKEGASFSSFKKVACDMGYHGEDGDERLQLVSFHSTSKGYFGECGLRGGYMELHGIGPEVRAEVYKLASLSLCSNTVGQLAMGMMVNPPKPGDASYQTFEKERGDILSSLRRRSMMVHKALNEMEGITCNKADGALYAFPRIRLPNKAVQAAADKGIPADEYYCLKVLDETGIILVPGSGFGQEEDTLHFRTTFLPSEDTMEETLKVLASAHAKFMDDHRD
uniref:Alanine transaminase n=1 Tax=Sargassum thunbergii TaxID=127542 RepID=A0A097ITX5_9PHAE|nr:alanine transaminase [Sargassum thunbergii]